MSEQKPYETELSEPDTRVVDVSTDSRTPLFDTAESSAVRPASENYFPQPDSRESSHNSGRSYDEDEDDSPGLFNVFLVWIALLIAVISLWQLLEVRSEFSKLSKNLARLEISLNLLEESQNDSKAQAQEELGHYQTQLDNLRRNLEFTGLPDVKIRVEQLGNRLYRLEKKSPRSASVTKSLNTLKGKWAVNLRSSDGSEKFARDLLASFKRKGIPASISTVSVGGKTWYRLLVSGFGTYEDAKNYAEDVLKKRGIESYWIRLSE